jgi:hypothetical protein
MNNFCRTPLAAKVKPNFYVLSDPKHHPESESEIARTVWQYLINTVGVTVLVPRSWDVQSVYPSICVAHFEDRSLEGLSKNIDPRRPRGYSSLTALKALALANFLGYASIFVLGLDNSLFKGLVVTGDNRILEESNHAPRGSTLDVADVTEDYPNGLEDYFFGLAVASAQLRQFFKAAPVINLNPDSFADAFPKQDPMSLTHPGATKRKFHSELRERESQIES